MYIRLRRNDTLKQPLFILLFFSVRIASAQLNDTLENITFGGYLETYYLYDLDNSTTSDRASWIYSYNRNNEVNINLAFLKASHNTSKTRANLALMTGTYANANLAQEPGVLKNIFEANVGVKMSKKHNLWIDMGVMPSHIGFESAVGMDCLNLTRSILADNSPYFESGAKITYTSSSEKWVLSGLFLNGWQQIQRPSGFTRPAFGHQVQWRPRKNILFNSSSFLGSASQDVENRTRYFHNFYVQWSTKTEWTFVIGFDQGLERVEQSEFFAVSRSLLWFAPVFIVKNKISTNWSIAARVEQFYDPDQVIIKLYPRLPTNLIGYSINLDGQISDNALWRLEARRLSSLDGPPISTFFTTALMIKF